jgi:hypothetical protein
MVYDMEMDVQSTYIYIGIWYGVLGYEEKYSGSRFVKHEATTVVPPLESTATIPNPQPPLPIPPWRSEAK